MHQYKRVCGIIGGPTPVIIHFEANDDLGSLLNGGQLLVYMSLQVLFGLEILAAQLARIHLKKYIQILSFATDRDNYNG